MAEPEQGWLILLSVNTLLRLISTLVPCSFRKPANCLFSFRFYFNLSILFHFSVYTKEEEIENDTNMYI